MYGTTAWRPIAADTDRERRRRGLIDLYRRQLIAAGFPLVTSFGMLDEGNRTEYFLYFGTTSTTGLSAMEQAMWKADPSSGTSFSDHIALNPQLSLVPATAPTQTLRDVLVERFKGKCSARSKRRPDVTAQPFLQAEWPKALKIRPGSP